MLQQLQTLAVRYAYSPASAAQELYRLLESNPGTFREAATNILKSKELPPAHQYLLTLLTSQGTILDSILEPGEMDTAAAVRIARRIQSMIEPKLAVTLARMLVSAPGEPAPAINEPERVVRVLAIVGEIARDMRLASILTPLLQHTDERVRSKAALVAGRFNRNLKWVKERQSDSDARVRANAVEALWGLDTPAAQQFFLEAMGDPANRVAANAALGLYRCGDPAAADALVEMVVRAEPLFRASAAWAMGETGDARFLNALSAAMHDVEIKVRQHAFEGLVKVRRRIKRFHDGPTLKLRILHAATAGNTCELILSTIDKNGRPVPAPRPLEIVVSEGNRVVHAIRIQPSGSAETAAHPARRSRRVWARIAPQSQFCVKYPYAPGSCGQIKVQVYCTQGFGEDTYSAESAQNIRAAG